MTPTLPEATTLTLSLISHTNVGKTTLARTLLQRDLGEVRDAPHVTEFSEGHPLVATPEGDSLQVWDTPGFGDSVRLARRMRQSAQPLVWVLAQAWDRFTDRPFWASQQALRHVRERTDLVLYLVNASEDPAAQSHVAAEMELLQWLGKPVLVLLNQLGAPRQAHEEEAERWAWQQHLQPWPLVQTVLPMDAFARCWVQELALWNAVEAALPERQRPVMARLRAAWLAQRMAAFDAAMAELQGCADEAFSWRETVASGGGMMARLRGLTRSLNLGGGESEAVLAAQLALGERVAQRVRGSTQQLLGLHGLAGHAQASIDARLGQLTLLQSQVDEGKAALMGGVVAGALAGLKADIAAGGLTMGGGALAGSILGALGAAGVARGVNLVRDTTRASRVSLNAQGLQQLRQALLLRYLAVAHFGRGRGEWVEGLAPEHWAAVVASACAEAPDMRGAARHALRQLYPEAMARLPIENPA